MDTSIKIRVRELIEKHGTRDPKCIADNLGIDIIYKSYSNNTKGYFINILGQSYIVINSNLDEWEERIVLAHELGHAILHNNEDIYFIKNHTLFPVAPLEKEANIFASELLIDADDIDACVFKGWDNKQIGSYLNVSEELVEYKLKGEFPCEDI